jgi:hypothetical protein
MSSARRNTNVSYVLFLLYPLAALVSSLRNFRVAKSKNIVWLFIVFYGFTFVFSNENLDSDRYKNNLKYMASQQATSFGDFVSLLYSDDTNYVDVAQPLLTFLLSRFTADARILFALFGLVFGFFYSRNLWFLFSFIRDEIRPKAIPLLVLAAFMVAIWQINGFRFWTAAHIFIFGLFFISQGKRSRGVLISASSIFMHFSFFLPVAVLFIYVFIGNRFVVCTALYFISFFIAQVSPESVKAYSKSLPTVFQERTSTYITEEYVKFRTKENVNRNWYLDGRVLALSYSINVLLLIILLKYRKNVARISEAGVFFVTGLLLASFANIFGGIPSIIRFQTVASLCLIIALFILVQSSEKPVFSKWVFAPFVVAACLYLVVELRIGFDTLGLLTLIGNPFIAAFVPNDTPLIWYIK